LSSLALHRVRLLDGRLADVLLADGHVERVERPGRLTDGGSAIDGRGLLLAPGFVDLQCNGSFGIDLTSEPERVAELGARLVRHGVTGFLPTLVSCDPGQVDRALAVDLTPSDAGARPLGWHLEGPFLAPARRGVHSETYLRPPDGADATRWLDTGRVRMMTLAPELPGAVTLIADLARRGVIASLGHSDATADEARLAVDAGARMVTHLFNAMAPLHHREPGLVGVAVTDERLCAGLIVDGHHVDPAVVALAWTALGARRTVLVTDAVAAAGQPPGAQALGDVSLTSDGTTIRTAGGTLAGSLLGIDQAVRNLVAQTGCALVTAVEAASVTPRRILGFDVAVAPGAPADLVLLDDEGSVVVTLVDGSVAHDADGRVEASAK
jgi:N-acetylglucosamine-6-phosphate deacetylase